MPGAKTQTVDAGKATKSGRGIDEQSAGGNRQWTGAVAAEERGHAFGARVPSI